MSEILLEVRHLTHQFKLSKTAVIRAVDDLSFQIRKGEIFGLVGESGSGKSTVARCVMNVYRPVGGSILYKGIDVCDPKQFREHRKWLQTSRQFIFQDSTSSLNQRMRVAIARALSMEPELLVADEPIASLDVSIQAQIINLFKHCNQEHGCSILFIAHDLAVVRYLCDRIGVMYHGKLVETAPTRELFQNPQHPYTQSLLSAIPIPDPRRERARVLREFDPAQFDRNGAWVEVAPDHLVLKGGEA